MASLTAATSASLTESLSSCSRKLLSKSFFMVRSHLGKAVFITPSRTFIFRVLVGFPETSTPMICQCCTQLHIHPDHWELPSRTSKRYPHSSIHLLGMYQQQTYLYWRIRNQAMAIEDMFNTRHQSTVLIGVRAPRCIDLPRFRQRFQWFSSFCTRRYVLTGLINQPRRFSKVPFL